MSVRSILTEEFENEMQELKKVKLGSSEQKVQTECVMAIADRIIRIEEHSDEENRARNEMIERYEKTEYEKKAQKRKDIWSNIVNIAGIVVPAVTAIGGMVLSLKVEFEDCHLITSTAGKDAMKKLFNLKKG